MIYLENKFLKAICVFEFNDLSTTNNALSEKFVNIITAFNYIWMCNGHDYHGVENWIIQYYKMLPLHSK